MTSPLPLLVALITPCGKTFQPAFFVKPGDIHFTPEGSAKHAAQVAEMIAARLKPDSTRDPDSG